MSNAEFPSWLDREVFLIGEEATRRIRACRTLVVGLGGVGGLAAELIVRAGVRRIVVADGDVVEASNRNRQIAALAETAGMPKTVVMANRLRAIDPDLELTALNRFLAPEDMPRLVEGFDCVVDAIDSVGPKVALLAACVERGIPVASSMGSGARLDPTKIRIDDISRTAGCPLARAVRKGLRQRGIATGIDAVFSLEPPRPGGLSRDVVGTISWIPAAFACALAACALKKLLSGVEKNAPTE